MTKRTLLQTFHWYTPVGRLWDDLAEAAPRFAEMGITDVWLPPAYKGASGGYSVGYDVYDMFDLGEFDQRGTVPTKYGDRAALERAAHALKDAGIGVIHDVVFNHRMGADEVETVHVRRVNPDDRTDIEPDAFEAKAFLRFTFPGRAGRHSAFIWDASCFSGIDQLEEPQENGVFRIVSEHGDEGWNTEVDQEFGNFDYLMGADVEFRNLAVYEELKYWGRWLMEQMPCDGFRLDAAKHIPAWFFRDWVAHVREVAGRDLFVVAEYWSPDLDALRAYLDLVDGQLRLFDVGLHFNFHEAGRQGGDYDMRRIFDGSLAAAIPDRAVTLVDNHDTQPLQSLEAPVEPWFKPIAYGLILLRDQGVPSVFIADIDGTSYVGKGDDGNDHEIIMPKIDCLPKLIDARRRFANGPQVDIFDEPNCVAFIREGTEEAPGCVVVITNGEDATKVIDLGEHMAGVTFRDFLEFQPDEVTVDDSGRATFTVGGGSLAVWVRTDVL